jgi:hypothetical protein
MEELCKKDGGVTVFETVVVPSGAFDASGRLVTLRKESRHGQFIDLVQQSYEIKREETAIKAGDPFKGLVSEGRLLRYQTTVRRLSDNKVLGTEITYGRTGGSLTLGHPSQNYCPKPRPAAIENLVFKKGN